MSHKPESRPTIFIDMKKSRIRIHRRTLQMLGNPTHIQLLVNPDSRTIAVKRTSEYDHLSHRIPENELLHHKCCELYSRDFLKALRATSSGWTDKAAYLIYGTLIESCNLVQFSMKNSIPVNNTQKGGQDK